MTQAIEKALSRAKIGLLQQQHSVFLSTVCFSLETIISNAVPTAGTDGTKLYVNPDFFGSLALAEQVGLLAHETLHVAYKHMLRKDSKNHQKWNRACDYVINDFLIQKGFQLPQGRLYDQQYTDLSSEQVYDLLPDDEEPAPWDDLLPPQGGERGEDSEGNQNPGSGSFKQQEEAINEILMRASLQAQISGEGSDGTPNEVQRMLTEMLKPKVDWRKTLARFFKNMSKSDYSYKKFNRKYLQHGWYMPTLISEGNLSRVDFAFDVSGSVTDAICTQFCSEVYSVMQAYSPEVIGTYQFDHAIQKVDLLKSLKDLTTLKFVGGGGTIIDPVFQEFKKSPAKALVILTDGHLWGKPTIKPDNRPIIWCIYDNPNFTCPFGKIIHISLSNRKS